MTDIPDKPIEEYTEDEVKAMFIDMFFWVRREQTRVAKRVYCEKKNANGASSSSTQIREDQEGQWEY